MSSSKLKKATRYVIERSKQRKKTTKKVKDSQARSDAEKDPGQFFVLNRENEAAKILKVTGIRLNLKERNILFNLCVAYLETAESRLKMDSDEKAFLFSKKHLFKKKKGDRVFVIRNFEAAKRLKFKTRNKEDLAQIQAKYLNQLERTNKSVDAAELSKASQLGHGERGIAASQFGLERAVGEAADKFDLSDAEVAQLDAVILRQRKKYNIKVDTSHQQLISSDGKFSKKFTFVLSSQYFEKNAREAQFEREAFEDTLLDFEVMEQETSTSGMDALEQVMLEAIAPKSKRTKVTGKRKKKVKERSKGKNTANRDTEIVTAYTAQRGVPLRKGSVKKTKAKRSDTSIVHLIGLFNQEINKTVAKNMVSPRLQYQTGRFADSVKITDVVKTKQGFPSIGYTYARDPYETFEVGNRQGNSDRDPRRVIDMSIREIALKMNIGRFYTRRV